MDLFDIATVSPKLDPIRIGQFGWEIRYEKKQLQDTGEEINKQKGKIYIYLGKLVG